MSSTLQRTKLSKQRIFRKRSFWIFLLIGVVVVVVILELTNVSHFFHKEKAISGTIPSTLQISQKDSSSTSQAASNPTGQTTADNPKSTAPSGDTALIQPFGNFVSNHNPSLKVSESLKEQSVCTTTPGAQCYIKFTQGNVERSLAVQTTNDDGQASWVWDVKQSGLTEGSWTITAIATLNGQSKTATDALKLEVKP